MGDYAPGSCTIHECPPGNEQKALEAVMEHLDTIDWCDAIDPDDGLQVGTLYTGSEARMGFEYELAPDLEALGCTFECHGDAKYEYDATILFHVPSLGTFSSSSTNDGEVTLTSSEIEEIARSTSGRDDLVEALLRRSGKAWTLYFDALKCGVVPPTIEEMVAARRTLTKVEEALSQ